MTRTTTEHTIVIQSAKPGGVTKLEDVGTGAVMPGQLAELETTEMLRKHAKKNGFSAKLVVLENPTPDTHAYPTTAAIDQPYTDGDTVYYAQGQPGDVFNMWIASGQNVKKGRDALISDANGRLVSAGTGVAGPGTSNVIGIPEEDANASGGTAIRCKVRIV